MNCSCFVRSACVNVFLYADDIIVLAPSIDALTRLLRLVEDELAFLDMALNGSKSVCIRYMVRALIVIACEISTNDGDCLRWVLPAGILEFFLVASRKFKISLDNNKKSCCFRENWPFSFRGSDCRPDFCEMLAGPHVWSGCMSGLCE